MDSELVERRRERAFTARPVGEQGLVSRRRKSAPPAVRHRPVEGRKGIYYSVYGGVKKFEVRYTDSDGKSRFETCGTRLSDALDRQAEIRRALGLGERVAPSRKTFGEVADEWLESLTVKEASVKVYRGRVEHARRAFGRRRIQDITPDMVAAFVRQLHHSDGGKGLILGTVSQVFSFASNPRRGYLSSNPCSHLEKSERPKGDPLEVRVFDRGELARLLEHSSGWLRPIVLASALTGMRVGEVRGLQWGDVDFARNEITVRRTISTHTELPGSTKSGKQRSVPLVPQLKGLLLEMVTLEHRETDWIFPGPDGRPRPYRTINKAFAAAVKRAKLSPTPRKPRFHDLRHTFASVLLHDGKDIVWVSKILGHANVQTTLSTYAHVIERNNRLEDAATRLSEALGV